VADLASLIINIEANTAELKKQLDGTEKALKKTEQAGDKTTKSLRAGFLVAAAAAAGLATAFVSVMRQQFKHIDALAKQADKLGISTEAMASYEHIANLTGTTTETLSAATQRLERSLAMAREGTETQAAAIRQLGLNTDELIKMSPDEAFYKVADSIGSMTDRADQAKLAFDLFGKQGQQLLGVMRENQGNFQAMADEAARLGLTFSRDAARGVEKFNDNMTRIQGVTTGLFRQMAIELAPALGDLSDVLFDAAQDGAVLHTVMSGITDVLKIMIKGLEYAIKGWEIQGKIFKYTIGLGHTLGAALRDITVEAEDQTEAIRELSEAHNQLGESSLELPERAARTTTDRTPADDTDARFAKLQESFMSERELEKENLEARMALIEEFNEKGRLTDEEAALLKEQAYDEHMERMNEIQRSRMTDAEKFSAQTWHRQTATVMGELGKLAQGLEGNSKKMFKIQKAGALASALVSTYEGVSKSLSAYPMPLGAVMAAAHLAAGLNQVNAIRKQQWGGGGGGGSVGASGAASAAMSGGGEEQSRSRTQDVRISLDADDDAMFSGRQVRSLMERMGNELSNGENFGSFQVVRG